MEAIKINDFSEVTLNKFNSAKESKSFLQAFDFARLLIENDFPISDVKSFMEKHFSNYHKNLDYSI